MKAESLSWPFFVKAKIKYIFFENSHFKLVTLYYMYDLLVCARLLYFEHSNSLTDKWGKVRCSSVFSFKEVLCFCFPKIYNKSFVYKSKRNRKHTSRHTLIALQLFSLMFINLSKDLLFLSNEAQKSINRKEKRKQFVGRLFTTLFIFFLPKTSSWKISVLSWRVLIKRISFSGRADESVVGVFPTTYLVFQDF